MSDNWYIGAIINLVGSLGINLGTNVLKRAYTDRATRPKPARRRTCQEPLTHLGMWLFILGSILNFVSFAFASQSLLAALGSVQFVSNVVFASTINKEEPSRRIILSTTLILIGNVVAVVFANHKTSEYDADELVDIYSSNPAFIVYVSCIVTFSVILHSLYIYLVRHVEIQYHREGLLAFCYAGPSGMICSMGVLFAKSLSILLVETSRGNSQVSHYFTWVLLVAFAILAVSWMYRLNNALKMDIDALLIVPLLQVFWTMFSIISGGIYFREFQQMETQSAAFFFVGVAIIVFGVAGLASSSGSADVAPEKGEMHDMGQLDSENAVEAGQTPPVSPQSPPRGVIFTPRRATNVDRVRSMSILTPLTPIAIISDLIDDHERSLLNEISEKPSLFGRLRSATVMRGTETEPSSPMMRSMARSKSLTMMDAPPSAFASPESMQMSVTTASAGGHPRSKQQLVEPPGGAPRTRAHSFDNTASLSIKNSSNSKSGSRMGLSQRLPDLYPPVESESRGSDTVNLDKLRPLIDMTKPELRAEKAKLEAHIDEINRQFFEAHSREMTRMERRQSQINDLNHRRRQIKAELKVRKMSKGMRR